MNYLCQHFKSKLEQYVSIAPFQGILDRYQSYGMNETTPALNENYEGPAPAFSSTMEHTANQQCKDLLDGDEEAYFSSEDSSSVDHSTQEDQELPDDDDDSALAALPPLPMKDMDDDEAIIPLIRTKPKKGLMTKFSSIGWKKTPGKSSPQPFKRRALEDNNADSAEVRLKRHRSSAGE